MFQLIINKIVPGDLIMQKVKCVISLLFDLHDDLIYYYKYNKYFFFSKTKYG